MASKKAGPRRNFEKLYVDYCPSHLKKPPIRYYPNGKTPGQITPFEKALDYVYSKFRNLYVHEGKGRLHLLPSGTKWLSSRLLDKYNNEYYSIDTLKILQWFTEITRESLYRILVSRTFFFTYLSHIKYLF